MFALSVTVTALRRLRDGDELRIGNHLWQVVVGYGHFHCVTGSNRIERVLTEGGAYKYNTHTPA